MKRKSFSNIAILGLLVFGVSVEGVAGIVGSKHDLSSASTTNAEVCVFCHTPHNANNDNGPLWNRKIDTTAVFQPYTSASMDTVCSVIPDPVTLACLSCHDAAAADGFAGAVNTRESTHNLVNPSNNIDDPSGTPNCGSCHPSAGFEPGPNWQIGPDLTDDHPVSMLYPTAAQDPDFNAPPTPNGWSDVKLYDGKVQCASCHNPHDPTYAPFLRKPIAGSELCYTCHTK